MQSPSRSASTKPEAVVVVDPLSSGAFLARKLAALTNVITVNSSPLTEEFMSAHTPPGANFVSVALIQNRIGHEEETLKELNELPFTVAAVVSGLEGGGALTDFLNDKLGLPGNSVCTSSCRRNKFDMGEALKKAGVRCAAQCRARSWVDAEAFVQKLADDLTSRDLPFRAVCKPEMSAGTDGVTFCTSVSDVKQAIETLVGASNMFSETNDSVIVQEFLGGDEYVVDTVSRTDPKTGLTTHKVTNIFCYDKRMTNGSPFVYFGVRLVNPEQKKEMSEYIKECLDAVGIRNHCAHSELKMRPKKGDPKSLEPVLVETGARPDGACGMWIPMVEMAHGKTALDLLVSSLPIEANKRPRCPSDGTATAATADTSSSRSRTHTSDGGQAALLERKQSQHNLERKRSRRSSSWLAFAAAEAALAEGKVEKQEYDAQCFERAPAICGTPKGWGVFSFLVSYEHKTLGKWGADALKEIRAMPSYKKMMLMFKEGDVIVPTTDMQNSPGLIALAHRNREVLERDYARIHELCKPGGGMYEFIDL